MLDETTPPGLATSPMTVAQALREGAARLMLPDIDNPRLEARLLLAHAMTCTAEDLLRDPQAPAPVERFRPLLDRRATHEPLAYIVGHREFWSLDFAVSPATLIPRPDSETVVEAALTALPFGPARVLDLGTGTGCLLLAVLHERPDAFGVGLDREPAAAALAAANAAALGLASRTAFVCGDWDSALNARFDLVLSNPPYITTSAIAELMPEVANHEPATCLDGGADGYDVYRSIVPVLPRLLKAGGTAVLEVGIGQAETVAAMGTEAGLVVATRCDLAGTARAIVLRQPAG